MVKNLIMWDWDGTIVNNHANAYQALQDMAHKYGLGEITDDDLQNVMGTYGGAFWTFHFGENFQKPYDFFITQFEKYNQENKPILFDGISEALAFLRQKGIPQIVLSNMPQQMLDEQSSHTGLRDYFKRVCGMGDGPQDRKPFLEHTHEAVQGIDADALIMVGDGESDLMTAKNAKARMIYIGSKARTDFHYDFLATSHRQILDYIKQLIGEA